MSGSNANITGLFMQGFDNELLPISRVLREAETRYSYYLVGHQFIVYTDHKPLTYLKAFKDIINKRFRWIEYLENILVIISLQYYIRRNMESNR